MTDRDLLDLLQESQPVMVMIIRRHDGTWSSHVRKTNENPSPYHVATDPTIRGAIEALVNFDQEIEDLL